MLRTSAVSGGKPDSPGDAPILNLRFKSMAGSGILENPNLAG